jgi:hypothetical protein
MFARLNQFDNALEQFEATLRLDPGNQPARNYLNRVQGWKRQQQPVNLNK